MDPDTWYLWLILFICILLSGFFSASETSFMSVNRVKLKNMQQHGREAAGDVLALTEEPNRLLTTILVGNNLVNIAATAMATVLFTGLLGPSGASVSTVVMTLVVLLLGEVTPKTIAKDNPEGFAMAMVRPVRVVIFLLTPVSRLFDLWRKMISGIYHPRKEDTDIDGEIRTMVEEAEIEGGLDKHEGSLIRSAIELKDSDALDIMTPRVDVEALDDTQTMEDAAELFRRSGYSRLPVYHEDMDHVVGILHEKDFYQGQHNGVNSFLRLMVPPVYAPATLKVSRLLKLFQSTRTHMVVVLDEFGGTEGIVTMEDVLEELVGEIYDEHDDIEEDIVSLEDGDLLISGSVPLQDLVEKLNLTRHYEADTVGGWCAEVLGCIPSAGSVFETEGLRGTVIAMDRRRVTQVRIRRLGQSEKNREEA